jgi:hypothetical protein
MKDYGEGASRQELRGDCHDVASIAERGIPGGGGIMRVEQEPDDVVDARLHALFKSQNAGRLHPVTATIIIASGIVGWVLVVVLESAH